MASTKKDKSAAAPEVDVCANCSAPEGQNDAVLKPCAKCKMTSYCGRAFTPPRLLAVSSGVSWYSAHCTQGSATGVTSVIKQRRLQVHFTPQHWLLCHLGLD